MIRLHRSAAFVTVLALALTACGGGSDSEPADSRAEVSVADETDADAAEPADTEPANTGVPATDGNDTVDAGRCGVVVGEGEYEPVDCAEPHDAEFAGTAPAPVSADSVSLMIACAPSIEALTGRPLVRFGLDVGVAVIDGDDRVECWAEASAEGTLSASILDDGLDAAIGDFVFITGLADGSCFQLADPDGDSYDLATLADCGDPAAEMLYGQFEADDGPVPDDATNDGFFARCDDIEADAEFDVIGNARYIISPLDDNWEALDRRTVLCIAWNDPGGEPNDELPDPDAAAGPVCANYDEALAEYPQVPCDEPHTAEFAGSVAPPTGDLPDDEVEASILLRQLCREPVELLTGRDLSRFGVGVGFVSIDGLGEPMVNDIRCYVSVEVDGALVGAIAEVGYDAALEVDIIAELAPGTCFVFADDDSFDVGEIVPCGAPDALMAIGSFVVNEPAGAPHPGDDALRALRAERCGEILTASGLSADSSTVSGTFPNEKNWVAFDQREVTCDATPR